MSAPTEELDDTLAGRVIAVPEARQLDVLAGLLERRGASVLRCPLVGIEDAPNAAPVVAWIERLIAEPTGLVVFYTGEGIERLLGFARRAKLEDEFVAALARTPKLTRGPKPKRALRRLDLSPEHEASEPTTSGLVATAGTLALSVPRVAIQLYNEDQDPDLVLHFERRSVQVDAVAPYVYASRADDDRVAELIAALAGGKIDAIAFTSKSQVQRLQRLARERGIEAALARGLDQTKVAAVGPVVSAELAASGIDVATMPEDSYSMKPLVTSLCELLRSA